MDNFLRDWFGITTYISTRYFLIAGLAYICFYKLFKNKFINRKIQGRFPNWRLMRNEIMYSMGTIFLFALMATLVFRYLAPYTNLYEQIADYGTMYYILSYVLMLIIHDTYFYWIHRLMHHPFLYKNVHLVHHTSTNPTPWSSYSFHPIESLLEAGIIPLIAFTIPVHKGAFVLFLLFQFIYNVYGHLGFELFPKGFHKTWLGKWINTSVAHNVHHRYTNKNYGLYFLFWDRILGTIDESYDKKFEKITK